MLFLLLIVITVASVIADTLRNSYMVGFHPYTLPKLAVVRCGISQNISVQAETCVFFFAALLKPLRQYLCGY